MTIEESIFNRYLIDENSLLDYGFNSDYVYVTGILNNTFKVIITYIDKKIIGKIIDLSFDEEYTNFRIDKSGEFNLKIKSEYERILLDIRDKACTKRTYIFDQANRINDYIYLKYKVSPDFPFTSSKYHGVYRNFDGKWFGILMDIPFEKIDKEKNGLIEVINVKINPFDKDNLIKIEGIYEAYHMNKKSWISIILNDTVSDELIFELIDKSYKLVNKHGTDFSFKNSIKSVARNPIDSSMEGIATIFNKAI